MYHQKFKFASIEQVKINKNLIRVLQLVIFVGACYVIYSELIKNQSNLDFNGVLENLNTSSGILLLIVVFLCQFVNWWLEALKFSKLISKAESINKWDSIKSVYAGNAVGVLTPNKVGTFIGRALYLKNTDMVC